MGGKPVGLANARDILGSGRVMKISWGRNAAAPASRPVTLPFSMSDAGDLFQVMLPSSSMRSGHRYLPAAWAVNGSLNK